jgi:hypothetical protein
MNFLKLFYSNFTRVVIAFFIVSIIISCEPNQKLSDNITQTDIASMKENHIIPLKEAVKMYDKYSKDRDKILKDTLRKKYGNNFNDTRMVWLDIKTMKAYLKYVEEESSKAGIDPEGLQFYFAVNSDKDTGKKKNHQTFFIAPTMKNLMNGDSIQSGFTIENGERIFLYEAFKKYVETTNQNVQKASMFSMPPADDGLLLNDTSGTPPGGNN